MIDDMAKRCEQQLNSVGRLPPNVNAARLCNCAVDNAVPEGEDPRYLQTPAGGQALMKSVVTCLRSEQGQAAPTDKQTPAKQPRADKDSAAK